MVFCCAMRPSATSSESRFTASVVWSMRRLRAVSMRGANAACFAQGAREGGGRVIAGVVPGPVEVVADVAVGCVP